VATYNKFNSFVQDLAHGEHDLETDQLTVALTSAANAPAATDSVLTDLTEIAYTNCSSRDITTSSSSQTSGTYKLVLTDLTLTASGSVGPFRYVVIYNNGHASDGLIGWYDYGSEVTLANGETFEIDFDGTDGLFQLA
jgi:hypothetical protein